MGWSDVHDGISWTAYDRLHEAGLLAYSSADVLRILKSVEPKDASEEDTKEYESMVDALENVVPWTAVPTRAHQLLSSEDEEFVWGMGIRLDRDPDTGSFDLGDLRMLTEMLDRATKLGGWLELPVFLAAEPIFPVARLGDPARMDMDMDDEEAKTALLISVSVGKDKEGDR